MSIKEEAQPRREIIDMQAPAERPFHVLHAIVEGEGELLQRRRTGLANVISADRDGVEARGEERSEFDRVHYQPHRWSRRKNEFLLRNVFLQNVVLQGAR